MKTELSVLAAELKARKEAETQCEEAKAALVSLGVSFARLYKGKQMALTVLEDHIIPLGEAHTVRYLNERLGLAANILDCPASYQPCSNCDFPFLRDDDFCPECLMERPTQADLEEGIPRHGS